MVQFAYTDMYWEMHSQLSAAGLLKHAAGLCPEQHAPRTIRTSRRGGPWEPYQVVPKGLVNYRPADTVRP